MCLVGPRALPFRGGDEKIVALHRKRAGIPVGGDESQAQAAAAESLERSLRVEVSNTATASSEESATNRYLPVRRLRESRGIAACILLAPACWSKSSEPFPLRWLRPQRPDPDWRARRKESSHPDSAASQSDATPGRSDPRGCFSLDPAEPPCLLVRSSSATCDPFHRLHHARRPSRVATTV